MPTLRLCSLYVGVVEGARDPRWPSTLGSQARRSFGCMDGQCDRAATARGTVQQTRRARDSESGMRRASKCQRGSESESERAHARCMSSVSHSAFGRRVLCRMAPPDVAAPHSWLRRGHGLWCQRDISYFGEMGPDVREDPRVKPMVPFASSVVARWKVARVCEASFARSRQVPVEERAMSAFRRDRSLIPSAMLAGLLVLSLALLASDSVSAEIGRCGIVVRDDGARCSYGYSILGIDLGMSDVSRDEEAFRSVYRKSGVALVPAMSVVLSLSVNG